MHSYVPFRATPSDSEFRFSISRGGRRGNFPKSAEMWAVDPAGLFRNITDKSGVGQRAGRGRNAVYIDLRRDDRISVPDVVYVNSDTATCPTCSSPQHHPFRNLGNGKFKPVDISEIGDVKVNSGIAVDVDNDGKMELVLFSPSLHIYTFPNPYTAREITAEVLPLDLTLVRPEAIAELDFDNDGDFDIYIADGKERRRDPLLGKRGNDILLENRDGVYVDVSKRAGIPKKAYARGVTTGDFDNDGFVDIYVTNVDEEDVLLRNNGDGTFSTITGLFSRPENTPGDMAQAVDYDADGRVDLIVSSGDRVDRTRPGVYNVLRNVALGPHRKGFVLVRVGSSPAGRAVSLHAVVRVTSGEKLWVRRVGSPGVAMSASYIELVHIGIGDVQSVDVEVVWVNGERERLEGVQNGSKVELGAFGQEIPIKSFGRLRQTVGRPRRRRLRS